MTEEERRKIISNDYADAIIEHHVDISSINSFQGATINYIDDTFASLFFSAGTVSQTLINESGYAVIPKLFALVDTSNLEEMNLSKVQADTKLNLSGQGVLLGFVDTGIDYTNPIFKKADNTTRIISIWDQTIENMQASEDIFYYGTEYSEENINAALSSENPCSFVPCTDEIGHGTALAGLVGGSPDHNENFVGVAPMADFVVVKLKPAKQNLRDYLFIQENTPCYQENDIMTGLTYLYKVARRLNRPIAICVGLGTNMGAHDGRSSICELMSTLAERNGIVIVTAAGNEGNAGHHYFGLIDAAIGFDTVELKVGENENGFSMEIWGQVPGSYSIDLLSPTGEFIPRIPARLRESRIIKFLFEETTVYVDYLIVEAQTGDQLIFLRFKNPAPGIWKIRVYGGKDITTGFHIWLPITGFIVPGTVFVKPNPDTTITTPGNANLPITITAYNHRTGGLNISSSRGYTRENVVKPDLAAPGVEIFGPGLNDTFSTFTGSSISTAEACGVCALLLEWGIVRKNFVFMDTQEVKKFLIRGVRRTTAGVYPNREWGYGIIDLYRTFVSLKGES
ncbi:MAG: hypothetical protein K0S61_952 [Anaerocolumna sp.]|jgi:subtilisin family serine protease|nr:hypothetical protein [Anaerocolumna sp.]